MPSVEQHDEHVWTWGFACIDCKVDTTPEYPVMLRNDLWREVAGKDHRKMLCRRCIERRLGRALTQDDMLMREK